ncbi:MAG: DUF2793 domain-containing protein [Alphaproteobacteria bacterium]|uniref:DUF2793 domain-containing protein n=1 Tax=Shimia sp. TaxID=1954381 RepID=UPI003296CC2D
MPQRILPGLGLTGFWDLGASYKVEMDANMRLLSTLVQAVAASRTTALPASGNLGDIYIAPDDHATNPDEIAVWDGEAGSEAWVFIAPVEGWRVYVADSATLEVYTGAGWGDLSLDGAGIVSLLDAELGGSTWQAGGGSGMTLVTDSGSDRVLADTDLAGNVLVGMTNAAANTVTVNSGLVGTEPVTVVQKGAGQTTFVAGSGVTINSADGYLKARVQYSSMTLIPDGTDNYLLVGDLAT